jgi:hypothetical protein
LSISDCQLGYLHCKYPLLVAIKVVKSAIGNRQSEIHSLGTFAL